MQHHPNFLPLLGENIAYSLSPALWDLFKQSWGTPYAMFTVDTSDFLKSVEALKTLQVPLMAVTTPYKKEAMLWAQVLSERVEKIGSANTLLRLENGLYEAHNTDYDGIAGALKTLPSSVKKILVQGAGGAVPAFLYWCLEHEKELILMNRDTEKAQKLQEEWQKKGLNIVLAKGQELCPQMLVNARPVPPDFENISLVNMQASFDFSYTPEKMMWQMELLGQGVKAYSGLTMLVIQAVHQLQLLTKQNYDISKALHDFIPLLMPDDSSSSGAR